MRWAGYLSIALFLVVSISFLFLINSVQVEADTNGCATQCTSWIGSAPANCGAGTCAGHEYRQLMYCHSDLCEECHEEGGCPPCDYCTDLPGCDIEDCFHLHEQCIDDAQCCSGEGDSCVNNADCCGGNLCRGNPKACEAPATPTIIISGTLAPGSNTVTATIDPDGSALTEVKYEYGRSGSCGGCCNVATSTCVGSSSSCDLDISISIPGHSSGCTNDCRPGDTCKVRVRAVNGAGATEKTQDIVVSECAVDSDCPDFNRCDDEYTAGHWVGDCVSGSCGLAWDYGIDCRDPQNLCDVESNCADPPGGTPDQAQCHYRTTGGRAWDWTSEVSSGGEHCSDGEDNDCDGSVDCYDVSDCNGVGNCCNVNSDCDDGNVCTTDTCTASKTCSNVNNANSCGTTSCPVNTCTGDSQYEYYNPDSCTRYCGGGSCGTCSCSPITGTCGSGNACALGSCDAVNNVQCHYNSGWKWNTPAGVTGFGESCADSQDNDCDSLFDEQDSGCGVTLTVTPKPSDWETTMTAVVTAGDGTLYGTFNVKEGGCGGATLCSVTTSGGSCQFNPTSCTTGDVTYHACAVTALGDISRDTDVVTFSIQPENSAARCSDGIDNDCANGVDCTSDTTCVGEGTYYGNCDGTNDYGCWRTNGNYNMCDQGGAGSCGNEVGICNGGSEADNDCDGLPDEADADNDCPLTFSLTPTDPALGQQVTATVNPSDGSLNPNTGWAVFEGSGCGGAQACPISGTSCTFNAPMIENSYTYTLCYAGINRGEAGINVAGEGGILCANGADDDGNGLIDEEEPGCPINLDVTPNSPTQGTSDYSMTATVDADDNSLMGFGQSRTIGVYEGSCQGTWMCNIDVNGEASDSCPFNVWACSSGQKTFVACIVVNNTATHYVTFNKPTDEVGLCDDDFDNDDCGLYWDEGDDDCGISLSFQPSSGPGPIYINASVDATLTPANSPLNAGAELYNLCDAAGCDAFGECNGNPIGSCSGINVNGQTSNTCQFDAFSSAGTYPIWACLGINSVQTDLVVDIAPEDCDNNIDDDLDGFFDEEDDHCAISLTVTPSPANTNDTMTATVTPTVDSSLMSATLPRTINIIQGADCGGTFRCSMDVAGEASDFCTFNLGVCSPETTRTFRACLGEQDKTDAVVFTWPAETCGDGIDNDCDGWYDEADAHCGMTLTFTPPTVPRFSPVTATISAVDLMFGTNGELLNFCDDGGCTSTGACAGSSVGGCASIDVEGNPSYDCNFQSPSGDAGGEGTYDYWACLGNNSVMNTLTLLTPEETGDAACTNGIDDDVDYKTDHEDEDCPIQLLLSDTPSNFRQNPTILRERWVYIQVEPVVGAYLSAHNKSMYIINGTQCSGLQSDEVLCEVITAVFNNTRGDVYTLTGCRFMAPNSTGAFTYRACIGNQTNEDDEDITVENPPEDCANGIDDDYDIFLDEGDADCGMTVSFNPNPASPVQPVTATITADDGIFNSNSQSFKVVNGTNCGDVGVGTCTATAVTNGVASAQCDFTAPGLPLAPDNFTYTACLDENYDFENLSVRLIPENDSVTCNDAFDNDADTYSDEADVTDCPLYLDLTWDTDVCPNTETFATITARYMGLNTGGLIVNITESSVGAEGSCSDPTICTIDVGAGDSCTYQTPLVEGNYKYHACVGNQDVTEDIFGGPSNFTVSSSSVNGRGFINGTVTDEDGNPMSMVTVSAVYPPPLSGSDSTITDQNGDYNLSVFVGNIVVKYSREFYFTEEESFELDCDYRNEERDVELLDGKCNADCYNWEYRCNPACDGVVFNISDGTNCSFYDSTTLNSCADKEYGTWVLYNKSPDNRYFYAACCEGAPFEVIKPPAIVEGQIEELYKRERILKDSNTKQPVKLVVNIWTPE